MSGAAPLWDSEGELPWLASDEFEVPTAEAWRGTLHPESDEPGWPEDLAGPEYRLNRDELDQEEGD